MADQEIKLNAEEYTQLKIRAEKADELQKSLSAAHQELEEVKNELEEKKKEVVELGAKVAELTDKINKNNEEFGKLHEELSKNKENLASVGSELNRMKRMVKLVEAGIEKSRASELVDKLANVDDDAFEVFVEQEKKLVERNKITAQQQDNDNDDDVESKASNDKDKEGSKEIEVNASTEDEKDKKEEESQEDDIVAKATKVFLS